MPFGLSNILRHLKRHWLSVAFALGFVTDIILLNRIDDFIDNMILLFYVVLATSAILFLYLGVAEKGPQFMTGTLKKYSPLLMQYAFGGLLSGMLIFYGRSGDWFANAPFLLMILAIIVGNEFAEKRSNRLVYNIGLYFVGLFSYVVLVVPVIIGKMGDWIFIFSGVLSLMIVTLLVKTLFRVVPNFMALNIGRVIVTIGAIYISFNALYFTNVIPPIPLSLTELEIVQSVSRSNEGNYRIEFEEQPWYRKIIFVNPIIHPEHNSIACYSRVYAPTRLSTDIFHSWQYKNEEGEWQEYFKFGYEITGASKGGYRGYTLMQKFFDGTWRCSVETKRGQVLGRKVVVIDTENKVKDIKVEIR